MSNKIIILNNSKNKYLMRKKQIKKTVVTKLPAGEIVKIEKLSDGTWKIVHEVESDDIFILIEAESLSLNDEFMQYQPSTKNEEDIKQLIIEAINSSVKNFYRPIMDPSFNDNGIDYVAGKKPAVGKSYNWWEDTAKKYNFYRNSRLGTRLEYGAFLGVLIKKLVEEGKSVAWVWNAVCNDSKELGHYWDSENAKHEFESTGSRGTCGFYDLANTSKILAEDEDDGGFWLAGGGCCNISDINPLADLFHDTNRYGGISGSVGWLVLS